MAITIAGKEYEVRRLNFDDVRYLSLIMDKTGFELGELRSATLEKLGAQEAEVQDDDSLAAAVGKDIVMSAISFLLRNYHKAHEEVAEWMATLIGVKPNTFRKLPPTSFVKILKTLAEQEDLLDFFGSVVQ